MDTWWGTLWVWGAAHHHGVLHRPVCIGEGASAKDLTSDKEGHSVPYQHPQLVPVIGSHSPLTHSCKQA